MQRARAVQRSHEAEGTELDVENGHGQRIAGFGAVDVDRSAGGIDFQWVARGDKRWQVFGAVQTIGRGVVRFDHDGFSGHDRENGRGGGVEVVDELVALDSFHQGSLSGSGIIHDGTIRLPHDFRRTDQMGPAELTAIIEQALQAVLDVEDYELTESFDDRGIDVSGDDWTWHVEDELAYLAIDDEPENASGYPAAIEKNLTAPVIAALRGIDPATLVVLADLLAASGDPLSISFAGMLRSS